MPEVRNQDEPLTDTSKLGVAQEVYGPGIWPNLNEHLYLVIFDTGVQLLIPRAIIHTFTIRVKEQVPAHLVCPYCMGGGMIVRPQLRIRHTCSPCEGTGVRAPSDNPNGD